MKKLAKDWTDTSQRKIHKWQVRHERCLTSSIIREIKIKTKMQYHYTHTRMTQIKNNGNTKCWREKPELSHITSERVKCYKLWKTAVRFLIKLIKFLPMSHQFSRNIPEIKVNRMSTNVCTRMFIANLFISWYKVNIYSSYYLFIVSPKWKQSKCMSKGKWVNQLWYIQTMEYYEVTWRNELLLYATTWINLQNMKKPDAKLYILYNFIYMKTQNRQNYFTGLVHSSSFRWERELTGKGQEIVWEEGKLLLPWKWCGLDLCEFIKTLQIIHLRSVQFIVCKFYSNTILNKGNYIYTWLALRPQFFLKTNDVIACLDKVLCSFLSRLWFCIGTWSWPYFIQSINKYFWNITNCFSKWFNFCHTFLPLDKQQPILVVKNLVSSKECF